VIELFSNGSSVALVSIKEFLATIRIRQHAKTVPHPPTMINGHGDQENYNPYEEGDHHSLNPKLHNPFASLNSAIVAKA